MVEVCAVVTAEVAAATTVPPEIVAYVLQLDDAPGACAVGVCPSPSENVDTFPFDAV